VSYKDESFHLLNRIVYATIKNTNYCNIETNCMRKKYIIFIMFLLSVTFCSYRLSSADFESELFDAVINDKLVVGIYFNCAAD
jgi:hypothetical protein